MFKLLSILNSVILVTSNPLQGATCPLASYQSNYVSEVPVSTNFNSYQQQNTVQYRLTPSIQTVPYSYNGQVNGYYLDNRLTNAHTSHVINPISTYNQDGLNTNYYSSNTNKTPKVVNNYIIVPADTVKVNQGNANAIQSRDVNKNYRYVKDNNCKGNNKCKREENCELRDSYNNYKNKPIDLKCDNNIQNQIRSENEVNNNKRKSSKKGDNSKQPKSSKRKKFLNVDENRKDDIKESNAKRKSNKNSNKKKRVKHRAKTEEKSVSNDRAVSMKTDEGIFMRDEEKCEKKTADVEVCFDINEECTCLENRKPRNNCYEPKTNYQPYLPRGLPENIMSYLNNVMSNPQLRQNYLSSFGLPYSYDYLYQIPQVHNSYPNESSKRGKIRRKSSKSNKTSRNKSNNKCNTEKRNENIGQKRKETLNVCKVVELEPLYINVEETKPNVQETQIEEVIDKKIVNETELKNIQEETIEAPQILGNTDWVQTTADDHSREVYMAPVGDDDIPDAVPELPDEYYPDFTSDKIYSSKEEYEYNFHDRHYYDSDNKAEMSIESRKYEHVDGKHSKHINDVTDAIIEHDQNKQKNNHKNVASKELEFRTPPPLLFPDFKTEMIHKDSFTARSKQESDSEENYSDNTHHYQNPFYDQKDQKPIDLGHRKGIETVFARSKVIKYGTKTKEEISSVSKETRNDDKNLFSTDGRTTVIIAKSLSYPEDY